MRIKDYGEMNLQDLDVMREIGSIGTGHAATALSQMLQKEVRITIPQVKILGYDEAIEAIGGNIEQIVGATLVKMDGDINGLMLFLFNLEFANTIFDKMMGMSYAGFEQMDTMAHSALTEIGNIIICSYVNAFTELVDMHIGLSVPSAAVNMLGAILTVPIAEYGYETDKLMYCNADFVIDGKTYNDWLLMLPDIASLNRILEKLGVS
ncbi:chemotaxis protein CheC [Oribacterium sp. WCC10]|uniref:chemotaxis protein CheC n=1 Tax=Oribacterium sp. WCC10 TaxID=1855343 RepID=UPI0008F15376|nr:chemotaxis protein CheC [Oribacterium sp. WCC10]SFG24744.1 chemotaxis protein CheC [Oribacterium sp. WCC10]